MANLGKLFKLSSKKNPESTRRDHEGVYRGGLDDLEDEGGYLDPTAIHATQPPTNSNSSRMPNYPPPRPHHLDSKRFNDNSQRASVPANFGDRFKAPQAKPRAQRPQSAGQLKEADGGPSSISGNVKGAADDYCDPWDARKGAPSSRCDDYTDPWDAQKCKEGRDNYAEPWDSRPVNKEISKDDYSDPWDSRNVCMDPKQRKGQGTQVTRDTKKSEADAPSSAPHTTGTPGDSDDDDSYCEPYDAGKVTAKNRSLKGMRLSTHEALDEEKHHKGRSALPSRNDDRVSSTKIPQSPQVDTRPADDYECPWESKAIPGPPPAQDRRAQNPSQDTRPVDDYECPWESKAIDLSLRPSSQERKDQNPTHDTRPLDDYDKPWEWNKKAPQWGGIPSAAPTAGQAPSVDQRPPDDYDKPWEWKKPGQFGAMMKGQPAGSIQNAPPPAKPPRNFQESDSTDPSLPLQQQCWYHGPLARVEAEKLLNDEEDCSFLVRNSESSKNDYSLSVRNNEAFMHLRIVCQDKKYILGQFSKPFDTVPAMIHHYSMNKLNIKGAEHKILLHPVRPPPLYNVLEGPK